MTFDLTLQKAAKVVAVLTTLYHIHLGVFGLTMPLANYAISFSLLICLVFLYVPLGGAGSRITVLDLVLALLSLAPGLYIFLNYQDLSVRPTMLGLLTNFEFCLGAMTILLVLESTRRTIGMPLVYVAIIGLLYCILGHYIPGMFGHSRFEVRDIVETMLLTLDGILGTPIAVVATLVIPFVLFGAFLEASGAAKFFVDLAMSLFGGLKGSSGHIGNFASILFGTMTGSPTASTVTVGSFMIPMMRTTGFSSIFAAAITSVSCTGASLMPPVMGTAAFLMAEMTGINYIAICKAALFPACLYFLACSLIVHFEASKTGVTGYAKDELPSFIRTLPVGLQYIGPISALIVLLIIGYSPGLCAVIASLLIYFASFLRKSTFMGLGKLMTTLVATARTSLSVATSCACAGIVVGSIIITGLGGKFASIVVLMSHQSLFLALFLTMIASLILGMGMPLPVVYILSAVLCGPAIAALGIPVLAAHLFLVYFACVSAVTPPVAVAAYAAAAIAADDPVKIGFTGFKYALPGFIIPYVIVYDQAILLQGSFMQVIFAILSCTVGIFALAAAVSGWMFTILKNWEKGLLLASGGCLIFPETISSVMGLSLLGVVGFLNRKRGMIKSIVEIK